MLPSAVVEPKPILGRRGLLVCWAWLLGSLGAPSVSSCGDPKPEVVARFPNDASVSGGGDGGAAGVTDAGTPAIPTPRGRVRVVAGQLVTDIGTPLRGALLPVDTGWTLADFDMVTSIAQTSGLNTLHVYLEDAGQVTGSMVSQADALVSLSAQAGLYLILGVGTGTAYNTFDASKIQSFWTYYGARYASSSHVLFEIQNNPEATCDKPIADATLDMERSTYALIRSLAPDSHVFLFSTTSIVQPSVLTDAVNRLGSSVDWSNASFGMDVTADCLPLASFSELVAAANVANVSLFINQLPRDGWGPYITRFEQDQIGWSHFRWFANNTDLASFRAATTSAGVLWCPERGSFPEDSNACR